MQRTDGRNMSLNEPRIFTKTPEWVGMEEISRSELTVWFRAGAGKRIMVMLTDVEKWERKS